MLPMLMKLIMLMRLMKLSKVKKLLVKLSVKLFGEAVRKTMCKADEADDADQVYYCYLSSLRC